MAETTQSSFLSPQAVSMLVQLGPAALQFFQGQGQIRKGKEMQSRLGPRVNYSIPGAATRALGVAERLAAPYEMPGADSRRYLQDMQNQKFLSGALQAGNTQDAMSLLTQGLEQAQLGELQFADLSAQDYAKRQLARQSALGAYAGYQDALTADRQKDFYERSKATTDTLTAGKTNTMGALQGLANTALMAMMYQKNGDNNPVTNSIANAVANRFTNPSTSNVAASAYSSNSPAYMQSDINDLKRKGMWDDGVDQAIPNNRLGDFSIPDLNTYSGSRSGRLDFFNPMYD